MTPRHGISKYIIVRYTMVNFLETPAIDTLNLNPEDVYGVYISS